MPTTEVEFVYHTGVARPLFADVRLCGGWDAAGHASDGWSTVAMTEVSDSTGCPAFHATVSFPEAVVGRDLRWGVRLDSTGGLGIWGIPTEIRDATATDRYRTFTLTSGRSTQHYWLSISRRLGANKLISDDGPNRAQFAVWAPNAREVDLVFGDQTCGYISDSGQGIVGEPIPMRPDGVGDGVWVTDPDEPRLANFAALTHQPYMFQITKDNGRIAYRTDLYSRCQVGRGTCDPAAVGPAFSGRRQDLDGTVGCSGVIDPDQVTELFCEPVWPETRWLSQEDFWRDEFDPHHPIPTRVEDLIIYELHVGGLGAGKVDERGEPAPGDLCDAIEFLDHLAALGINAVELMPMAEFEGWASWGYGTSHYLAVEFSGGGRDQLKHFVRACHRRGIAVIIDVVYNHFHHHAERAEWAYDSDDPRKNIYFWYEGEPSDYPDPTGGYIDNMSTGWAPRFWEEPVRQWMVSSAVAQAVEFHIDGFRVDQTTSLHQYPVLHADGRPAESAKAFGAKFLRELSRTLRLVKPTVMLIAEDHSGWEAVTRPADAGGLGFDATWYSDFYHHLCGDTGRGPDCANLLTQAAIGDNRPLAMSYFAGALAASANAKVVYHESHDEAGNSTYPGGRSGRTIVISVNRAPLVGETRRYAEARSRFACGMSMLAPGTPMFFMGEEIGASEDYRYNDFIEHRTDLAAAAHDGGANLFAFYRSIITLRLQNPVLRCRTIQIVHVDDGARVLAFRRQYANEDLLVIASLNDTPFRAGYQLSGVPDGLWREVFNSDSEEFGGWNDGNAGGDLTTVDGRLRAVIPRAGFVVLRHL